MCFLRALLLQQLLGQLMLKLAGNLQPTDNRVQQPIRLLQANVLQGAAQQRDGACIVLLRQSAPAL